MSPPRTRGSTCAGSGTHVRAEVSPAHAGIDPFNTTGIRQSSSLPRARGDRPAVDDVRTGARWSPPRTRGSTRLRNRGMVLEIVSPAHAGIDPPSAEAPKWKHCLPRARGDRPHACAWRRSGVKSPPRTRGSTRRASSCRRRRCVSPAHAGIAPPDRRRGDHHLGLPRARGDRPDYADVAKMVAESPPRTRGSTLSSKPSLMCLRVSPAHAGIDLVPIVVS